MLGTTADRAWYAARFRSGEEASAARELCNGTVGALAGFCPLVRVRWVNRGVRHERLMPVMAGYAFVEMPMLSHAVGSPYAHRWREVAVRRGFLGFVGGDVPQQADRREVNGLVARACPETWEMIFELGAESEAEHYERGTPVRVAMPGQTLNGIVEWMRAGAETAKVRMRGLFSSEVYADVPVACLERVRVESKRARKTFYDLPVVAEATVEDVTVTAPQYGRRTLRALLRRGVGL